MNRNDPNNCFLGLTPYTLIADASGSEVNVQFPLVKRLATFTFDQNLGILGLQLSSSITNTETDLTGIFIFVGTVAKAPIINITNDSGLGLWLSHISNLNAVPGFASPASRSTTIGFSESGIYLQAGDPVAIYGCSGPSDDNLLAAVLNIYTIPVK